MSLRHRPLRAALAGLLGCLSLSASAAAVEVSIRTTDVDDTNPACFQHGTEAQQEIVLTNRSELPVRVTVDCSVPSGDLRQGGRVLFDVDVPAGATETATCGLLDHRDPPAPGDTVSDFTVLVDGVRYVESVDVVCRPHPQPLSRCATRTSRALARSCRQELRALAGLAGSGDFDRFSERVSGSRRRLFRALTRIAERSEGACPAAGDLAHAGRVLDALLAETLALAPDPLEVGRCERSRLSALARHCGASLGALAKFANSGDAARRETDLALSDARLERSWARAAGPGEACGSDGLLDPLRAAVDGAIDELLPLAGLGGETPVAELLRPSVDFAPGERVRFAWVAMPAPGALVLDAARGVHVVAFDRGGRRIGAAGSVGDALGAAELALPEPSDHVGLVFTRSGALDAPLALGAALAFDDADAVFGTPAPAGALQVFSPLRTFPEGEDVLQLPPGAQAESFEAWVYDAWGWFLEEGLPAELWLSAAELAWSTCPAGQAAPGNLAGPTPPPGSSHDANYCGISVFVHSMLTTFPGALAGNVTSNAAAWDAVGASIDHSNWFGTRGAKLVDNVNENYQGAGNVSSDGRQYCAAKLSDVSPANLAAWQQDCNLKLLTFDFSNGFGHWADVTAVTPSAANPSAAALQLQDYGASYPVGYTVANNVIASTPMVDFSNPAAAGSTMAGNFTGANTVAGDDWDEPTGFSVVCLCDTGTGTPKMPTRTRSGTALRP